MISYDFNLKGLSFHIFNLTPPFSSLSLVSLLHRSLFTLQQNKPTLLEFLPHSRFCLCSVHLRVCILFTPVPIRATACHIKPLLPTSHRQPLLSRCSTTRRTLLQPLLYSSGRIQPDSPKIIDFPDKTKNKQDADLNVPSREVSTSHSECL